MFSESFVSRHVNSLYLDTLNLNNYNDAVLGNNNRIKIRIRWYGELTGLIKKPMLEIKIKKSFANKKLSFPLKSFNIERIFKKENLQDLFARSNIPIEVKAGLSVLSPVLINRYKRRYFVSADSNFRITQDSEVEYYCLLSHLSPFFQKSEPSRNIVIAELKYALSNDDYANKISNHFPFRLSKNSKYVNGIELITLGRIFS